MIEEPDSPCHEVLHALLRAKSHTSYVAPPHHGPFSDEEYALVLQSFNKYKNKQHQIHTDHFRSLFRLPTYSAFASSLFQALKLTQSSNRSFLEDDDDVTEEQPPASPAHLSFQEFFHGVSSCSRASSRSILRLFFYGLDPGITGHGKHIPVEKAKIMFRLSYSLAYYTFHQFEDDLPECVFGPLEQALVNRAPGCSQGLGMPSSAAAATLSFEDLFCWVNETVPLIYQCLGGFIYRRVCPGMAIPDCLRINLPYLIGGSSSIIQQPSQLFGLALVSATLQGPWYQLYSSEDGFSFDLLCRAIIGYQGPTVLLLKDADDYVFGFYTFDPWHESTSYYGESECFLFRLSPDFFVIKPRLDSDHRYMYLNNRGYSQSSHPKGLGVGGSIGNFRLFIPESLEGCTATSSCRTFDVGSLASMTEFDLVAFEVWGVGGESCINEALAAQGRPAPPASAYDHNQLIPPAGHHARTQ